jgi:hypothetical protein
MSPTQFGLVGALFAEERDALRGVAGGLLWGMAVMILVLHK